MTSQAMEFTSEFIVLLCYFQFCDIYVYIVWKEI
jgi:hypothetical protein